MIYVILRYDGHDEGNNLEHIASSRKKADDYISRQMGHHLARFEDFSIEEWEIDVTSDHTRN